MSGFTMSDSRWPNVSSSLGLGHFLFLSGLFWAGGVHHQTAETFLGAPILAVPLFSQTVVQGLIYLLGLASLAVFVAGWRGTETSWSAPVLIGLALFELYFCALDVRLAGRFWFLLLLLTVAFAIGKESWVRVGFFALPASGVWGVASLVFLTLLVRFDRRQVVALALVLFIQGQRDSNLDFTIFAWSLAITLFWQETKTATRPQMLAGAVAGLVSALWMWGAWGPVTAESSFVIESRTHTLLVKRTGRDVQTWADGELLEGPWYIEGDLIANPRFFSDYPGRLNSRVLYDAYGRQLQQRYQVGDFRFQIHTAGRASGPKKL
jgi:hypothetical protein